MALKLPQCCSPTNVKESNAALFTASYQQLPIISIGSTISNIFKTGERFNWLLRVSAIDVNLKQNTVHVNWCKVKSSWTRLGVQRWMWNSPSLLSKTFERKGGTESRQNELLCTAPSHTHAQDHSPRKVSHLGQGRQGEKEERMPQRVIL